MHSEVTVPLRMKDLLARTGVSREAIHYYLREGLLPEPDKPKQNVAFYSEEHVVRIQAIKRLQRDRALPLSEIKLIMSNFDYGALPASDDLARFEIALQSQVNGDIPSNDQPLKAVARTTGLSLEVLLELAEQGIITLKHKKGQVLLGFRDVGIVECWARLMQSGFEGKRGFDIQFLRRYSDALKVIALPVVESFFEDFGETPTSEAAELAATGIGIANEMLTRLHTQALMRVLHERIEGE